jgi:uncharacterized membrane protein HdeD (DUF308 family)
MRFDWPASVFYLQGFVFLIAAAYVGLRMHGSGWPLLAAVGLLGVIFGVIRTVQDRRALANGSRHG